MTYTPLPHDSVAPPPSGILPNTSPDSRAVWTVDVDAGSGQRHGDAVMEPDTPPAPPEPEREPIKATTGAAWADLNDYEVGSEVFANVAAYSGGNPDTTTYRYRWQTRPTVDDSWVNGSWTNYSDHALEVSTTITESGQLRFQCQARDTSVDPAEQVNSFAAVKNVPFSPLKNETPPSLSGIAAVGETLNATKAVYSGGIPPVTVQSQIQSSDAAHGSAWSGVDGWGSEAAGTHQIGLNEDGKYFRVAGRGVDQSENAISQAETLMSFSEVIGPVKTYDTGEISVTNSITDEPITNGGMEFLLQGVSATYIAEVDGDIPQEYLKYEWKIRAGGATIRGQADLPYCTIQYPTEYPGSSSISCSIYANSKYGSEGAGFMWTVTYTE